MSNQWNIWMGIGVPQGTNGTYNKPYIGRVNAKRICINLWPSSKFLKQQGPLSALQNSNRSML